MKLTNYKGQHAGSIRDGVYRKRVRGSKHFMQKFNGWGISADIISEIKDQCQEIRIKDEETEVIYSVPFKEFLKYARAAEYEYMQYFLSVDRFDQEYPDGTEVPRERELESIQDKLL